MVSIIDPQETAVRPVLDTDQLRTFVTIAETGSFSRAAEIVLRTPSAISMQIKKLEETLGRRFFERTGRGVTLTGDGEELLAYGRRILKLSEEAVSHFMAPELRGRVRIGTPDDFAPHLLPEAFSRFARTHPFVQVEIFCDMSITLSDMMAAGKIDMALVTSGTDDPRQPGISVLVEPLVWAACRSGEAAFRRPVPLALCDDGCSWRERAIDALDAAGIERNIAYLSRSYSGQYSALLADLAVAPLPLSFARGDLRDVTEEAGLPGLGTYELRLIRPRGNRNAVHDALQSHILDSFRPYAAGAA